MNEDERLESSNPEHWFSDTNCEILLYKINRRPITSDPSLFEPDPDLPSHLKRVLSENVEVVSGHNPQRTWRLGNIEYLPQSQNFTAVIGWERSTQTIGQSWDPAQRVWADQIVNREDSAVAPIAFRLRGRILGVLKHPSFTTETTLDRVLTKILNQGENSSAFPTTAWKVEPIGDEADFLTWLNEIQNLDRLSLHFERPNPDAEEDFQKLFDRLDTLNAKSFKEEITSRPGSDGLSIEEVKKDKGIRAYISAAMSAFGRISAKGRIDDQTVKYDQRQRVKKLRIEIKGNSLIEAGEQTLQALENETF